VSETWYLTRKYAAKLESVQVDRFTSHSIWVDGRRRSKRGGWENYFPTWEEARIYLLEQAENRLAGARWQVQQAEGLVGNIKGLKPPTLS
jgi:hypothetical protein